MKCNHLTLLALGSLLALGAVAPAAFADPDHGWGDRRGWDDRRDDRRHYDHGYRDGYREARHDDRRYDDRRYGWRPGPPPPHMWARGQRYHDYYRGPVYVVDDYPRYELRRPPRGYHWVRDDRGNLLMVAIASGIIADLVLNH